MTNTLILPHYLLAALAERKISQADLTRLTGLSQSRLSYLLRSATDPRWLVVARQLLAVANHEIRLHPASRLGRKTDLYAQIQAAITPLGNATQLAKSAEVSWTTAERWLSTNPKVQDALRGHIQPWQAMLLAVGQRLEVFKR